MVNVQDVYSKLSHISYQLKRLEVEIADREHAYRDGLVSAAQVARMLNVTPQRVYQMRRKGTLPEPVTEHKPFRWKVEQIEQLFGLEREE